MNDTKKIYTKFSIFPFISMFLSLFAFYLNYIFWGNRIKLDEKAAILFCVLGFVTMTFPLLSKYFRKISGLSGKILEIIAFTIGCFNFYNHVFVYTNINLYIPIFLVAICIITYSVAFIKINANTENNKVECSEIAKNIRKMNFIVSIIVVFCILNLFVFLNIKGANLCFESSPIIFLSYLVIELLSILTFCICSTKIIIVFVVEIIVNIFNVFLNVFLVFSAFDYHYDDALSNLWYSFISLTIYFIVFCVFLCYTIKIFRICHYNSLRYREKMYKKVAKIHQYYVSGVITLDEFEKTKKEILKNVEN